VVPDEVEELEGLRREFGRWEGRKWSGVKELSRLGLKREPKKFNVRTRPGLGTRYRPGGNCVWGDFRGGKKKKGKKKKRERRR